MFSPAMQEAVTQNHFCYRAYIVLTSCLGEKLYIESHEDVGTPPEQTSSALLSRVGGRSQGVDARESVTTIGATQFQIIDFDAQLTEWLSRLRECHLGGATIQYFVGEESVPFGEYHCVSTTVIQDLDTKFKRYTFNTDDTTRIGRKDIFDEVCAPSFGSLFEFDFTGGILPVNASGARGIENARTIYTSPVDPADDGVAGLELPDDVGYFGLLSTLQQDEPFQILAGRYNEPPGIFVKTDNCEILELAPAVGQIIAEAIPEEVDSRGRVIQEAGAASTGFAYPIIGRAQLGTQIPDSSRGESITDGSAICQALTLKGPVPFVLYALMTGKHIETGEDVLPTGSHAAVDPDFIDLSCMGIDENGNRHPTVASELWKQELDFRCPAMVDAKAFWEEQVLSYVNHYLRVDCNGRWCLTPLPRIGEFNEETRSVNHDDIIRIEPLRERYDFPTGISYGFDKDPCSDSFNNGVLFTLNDDTTACVEPNIIVRRYEGVRSSLDSVQRVRSKACRTLFEYSQPQWTTEIELCLRYADIQQGDSIRVTSSLVFDYHGTTVTLDRPFHVGRTNIDWLQGTVRLSLSTPTKPVTLDQLAQCDRVGNPCASAAMYTEGRTQLPVGGDVVTGALRVPAGNYYHDGNLRIEGSIEQTTRGTLNIAVNGIVSGSGQINTSGAGKMGQPGFEAATPQNITDLSAYGSNRSQGGVQVRCTDALIELPISFGDLFEDQCRCRIRYEGSTCTGAELAPIVANSPADLLDLNLWGSGGCGGGGITLSADSRTRNLGLGGTGGDGGGGLILVAHAVDGSDGLTLDTSGLQGELGQGRRFTSGNSIDAAGGSGAGGNAGRILIALDGVAVNTIPPLEEFVVSNRGLTPVTLAQCVGEEGNSNVSRNALDAVNVITLDCLR